MLTQTDRRERYLGEWAEKDDWALVCALVGKDGVWALSEQRSYGVKADVLTDSRARFCWSVLSRHIDEGVPMEYDTVVRLMDDAIDVARREDVLARSKRKEMPVNPVLSSRGELLADILYYEKTYHVSTDAMVFLARRAVEQHRFKETRHLLQDLLRESSTWTGSQEDYVAKVQASVLGLKDARRDEHTHNMGESLHGHLDKMWVNYHDGDPFTGMRTGFSTLDRMTRGMEAGDLIVVSAKSGVGKSAFVTNIARNVAKRGVKVVFFSLEMIFRRIMNRMVYLDAKVDSDLYYQRKMSDADWQRIIESSKSPFWGNITVEDDPGIDLPGIHAKCRQHHLAGNADLIIVDYTQLVSSGQTEWSREQEVAKVSRGLKRIAQELQVPVITLSQLNESGQTRESKGIHNDSSHHWIISESDCKDGLGEDGAAGRVKRYEVALDKGRDSVKGQVITFFYRGPQVSFAEEAMSEDSPF